MYIRPNHCSYFILYTFHITAAVTVKFWRNIINMVSIQLYDSMADIVNVEEIATNAYNRSILRRLQVAGDDDAVEFLYIISDHEVGSGIDYVPE